MPSFSFRAIDASGVSRRGALVARDENEALDNLARKGLTATDLRPSTGGAVPWWQREVNLSGPSASRLLPVFVSLATLLKARVPLAEALGFVQEQTTDVRLATAIGAVRDDLENGRSLGQSLEERSDVFTNRIITLLGMGEATDTLPETCDRVVTMLRSEAEVASEIRSAMIYPVILLFMSTLVLGLLIFYLVPTLLPVFDTASAAPPPMLRVMDGMRVALLSRGWSVLAIALAGGMAAYLLRAPLKSLRNRLLVRAPVTGAYLRKRHSLSLCQTLGVMLEAGMSSLDGLDAAAEAMPIAPWRRDIASARAEIEAGTPVSAAVARIGFLDPMAKSLIVAGDETDQLAPMLRAAAIAMQGETQTTLKRALSLLTPALTLAIGLVVGALIVSTITAILDLNDIAF
ncbi:type II secretion system F family protein [uncultured Tateyamaria sp.]|uniref:type II secretion system F family protein n=1 Tax=Tateyamaria sp. 1078 TaxID=3417464 RepID=UPI002610127A|nr:type II secretion system F family protein [uncultured Tateyamaria sp.]